MRESNRFERELALLREERAEPWAKGEEVGGGGDAWRSPQWTRSAGAVSSLGGGAPPQGTALAAAASAGMVGGGDHTLYEVAGLPSLAVPKLEFELEEDFEKKLPVQRLGPILLAPSIKFKMAGKVSAGSSPHTMTVAAGKVKFKTAVGDEYAQISIKGTPRVDKDFGLEVALGKDRIKVKAEFKGVNLLNYFKVEIKLIEKSVKATFGVFTFEGKMAALLEFAVAPNFAWPGWAPLLKTAKDFGRALARAASNSARIVITAVRGLFVAGEIGTYTTFGALALGAGAGMLAGAWILFVLYKIGDANLEARRITAANKFCNGYMDMFDRIVIREKMAFNDQNPADMRDFHNYRKMNWKPAFKAEAERYVKTENKNALEVLGEAGRAAMFQAAMEYIYTFGAEEFKAMKKFYAGRFNPNDPNQVAYKERINPLRRLLYEQAKNKKPLGIPPFVIRN